MVMDMGIGVEDDVCLVIEGLVGRGSMVDVDVLEEDIEGEGVMVTMVGVKGVVRFVGRRRRRCRVKGGR